MTTRRVLEIETEPGRIISYRTPWGQGNVVMITRSADGVEHAHDGDDVEQLHQFTFELLAGRRTDPRLDVPDTCGYRWYSATAGEEVDCCLNAAHSPLSVEGHLILHVTSGGDTFEEIPF